MRNALLIDSKDTDDVIHWDSRDHTKFEIRNLTKLREETLKKHYTAKWETFRRQLYFYGFKSYEKDKFWSQPKLDRQNKEVTIHVVISICFPVIFILLGISYRK